MYLICLKQISPVQLDEDYNSKEFKGIIKLFKDIVPAIAKEKIDNLTKYLN